MVRPVCFSFPFPHLGEVLLLLGLISIANKLIDAEVGVGTITESYRCRSSAYLLHHQHMLQVAQARAPVLDWEWRLFKGAEKAAQIKPGH